MIPRRPTQPALLPARPLFLLVVILALAGSASAQMQGAGFRPELLRDVGIDQKLGGQVPLDLGFRDEQGSTVSLGQFVAGKPVVLALVYYQCPMLCTVVLNGVLDSLKQVPLDAGKQYQVVAVSIDPRDRPIEAQAKKLMYAGLYGRRDAAGGWHFLTGDDPQIHTLADAVGFRYAYDSVSGQYAHAAAIMILTGDGKVSRYLYGTSFTPRDLRLGLVDASSGHIGSAIDQVLLFCYHYDASTGRYAVVISRVIQIAGLVTILAIGALIFALARQTPRVHPREQT
jgi:protein SCO1